MITSKPSSFEPRFGANPPSSPTEVANGYVPGKDVVLAMDAASSEFYDKEKGVYVLADSGEGEKTTDEMIKFYEELVSKYPISIPSDNF